MPRKKKEDSKPTSPSKKNDLGVIKEKHEKAGHHVSVTEATIKCEDCNVLVHPSPEPL